MREAHPFIHPSRPFIVYLADFLTTALDAGSDIPRAFWDGMQEESIAHNADMLAVAGGVRGDLYGSVVFDLITPESADGFLSWSRVLGGVSEEYLSRFQHARLMRLLLSHPIYPTVDFSNASGIQDLVEHLFHVHGCRRIGFIRGPAEHDHAQARYQSYCETLAQLGLPFDESLVSECGLWELQGEQGVATLFNARGLQAGKDIDALVCASDRIAISAMNALLQRGIKVPDDLAVTGFNNVQAQSHIPSLTSVAAPFGSVSRHAYRALQRWIKTQQRPEHTETLKSTMVIAESCGCNSQRLHELGSFQPHTSDLPTGGFDADFHAELHAIFCDVLFDEDAFQSVLDAFLQAFAEKNADIFISPILDKISHAPHDMVVLVRWQDVITVFRKHCCAARWTAQEICWLEWMLNKARVTITDHFFRLHARAERLEQMQFMRLHKLGSLLSFSADLPEIMNTLSKELRHLEINACWLSVFEPESGLDKLSAPRYARLLLAVENGIKHDLPDDGLRFLSRQLIAPHVLRAHQRRTLMLYPLSHADEEYGFIIFEQCQAEARVYQELASIIGGALRNAHLRAALERRTAELEASISELERTRAALVENEKLAALGELVAGVAHEINTPIGVGVTAVSTLAQSAKQLQTALQARNGNAVRQEAALIVEASDIALRNLSRASALIDSFKNIAVDQSYEVPRRFKLAEYLNDIALSLAPRLRPQQHEVNIDCPKDITLNSYPGALSQILSNLILNSVIHGFDTRSQGQITIRCQAGAHLEIHYYDNGIGMSAETLDKIYLPFFTTKRGQGSTGLGMHIVHNLITQKMGGSIVCQSSPEHGVYFLIKMPFISPDLTKQIY